MFHVRRLSMPLLRETLQIADLQKTKKMKKINQYLIIQKIGSGVSAKVYLALNTETAQYVAIKTPKKFGSNQHSSSPSIKNTQNSYCVPYYAQIERDIALMQRFNEAKHPAIIQMHEVLHSVDKHIAYIVFEWADCGSLKSFINKKYQFTDVQLATIFKQILEGLQFVHSQGIAHEDIKPSNLLIFSDGKAKISDFGIGHKFESADTVIGSPAYQAPEVIDDALSEIDFLDPSKEDVWSLGVTLFETKFHILPYNGENFYEIAHNIRQKNPLSILNTCSENLRDLILKMLEMNPSKRISVQELLLHPFFELDTTEPLNLPVLFPDLNLNNGMHYPEIDIEHISAIKIRDPYSFSLTDGLMGPLTIPPLIDT